MTTSPTRRQRALLFLTTALMATAACTTANPGQPSQVSAALRDQLGTVGVVARYARVEIDVRPPASTALKGLGCGALVGLNAGAQGGSPLIFITAPAGLVIGAIAGGAIAVAKAPPADEVRAADAALRRAIAELDMPDRLASRSAERAGARARLVTPTALGQEGSDGGQSGDLDREAIDSSLEVSRVRLSWADTPPCEPHPQLELALSVHMTIRRSGESAVLDAFTLRTKALPQPFAEWGLDDARSFRDTLDRMIDDLATSIAFALFSP